VKKHTGPPWQWVFRMDKHGGPYLATPDRGHLIVMDFVRLGMQQAQPRFAVWDGDDRTRMGGIMKPATEIELASHPDARLIESSPALLEACKEALRTVVELADYVAGEVEQNVPLLVGAELLRRKLIDVIAVAQPVLDSRPAGG